MPGNNTYSDKRNRAYEKLLILIINDSPDFLIESQLREAQKYNSSKVDLEKAKKDAKKYVVHYQAAKKVLVNKDSPLGKILLRKQELLLRKLKTSIDDMIE